MKNQKIINMTRIVIIYLFSAILVFFALFPIITCYIGSITPETEIRSEPHKPIWVKGPTFYYYEYIFGAPFGMQFTTDPYLRYEAVRALVFTNVNYTLQILLNSFIVAAGVAFLNVLIGGITAYAFTRLRFPGSTGVFTFILLSRLLPPIIIAVPYYAICYSLGITNTLLSLLLVHGVITLPFTIWYLTLYYRTIPVEIEESALVDGCSYFQAFRKVAFPTASSGLMAAGLFSFMLSYNDLLFAQFLEEKVEVTTIPLFIAFLSTQTDLYFAIMYAVLSLTFIPVILMLIVLWKKLNITELVGALKM
jgi:ABC-type glycerol-3-phosphate transport system permease component